MSSSKILTLVKVILLTLLHNSLFFSCLIKVSDGSVLIRVLFSIFQCYYAILVCCDYFYGCNIDASYLSNVLESKTVSVHMGTRISSCYLLCCLARVTSPFDVLIERGDLNPLNHANCLSAAS